MVIPSITLTLNATRLMIWIHLFVTPSFKSYWKEMHDETPSWWIFGVIWFWSIWHLQILSERKMTKIPFIGQDERATNLLEIIHSDVCSPICVAVHGGSFYFINFHRWFEWIYMYIYSMRKKYEIFEKVQRISAWSRKTL